MNDPIREPARPIVGIWKAVAALAVGIAGGYAARDGLRPAAPAESAGPVAEVGPLSEQVLLSEQAQKNLGLTAEPLKAGTYWKTISVPGMVVDRPGFSDRGVVAPAVGIITAIRRFAGDAVAPGDPLFTLRLLSETLHQTQTELFKATQDEKLAVAQRRRLDASAGAIPEARLIEADNQVARLRVALQSYRHELHDRGLSDTQIGEAAEGRFVHELTVAAPARSPGAERADSELQELKVELGQQVQAGQTLALLANHRLLAVEGRAFRDEASLLERTVREGWPVAVDFGENGAAADWPPLGSELRVTYVANSIDPESRTFRFLLPLENQSRAVEKGGGTQVLWRFRPGQRVRLLVRTEAIENVFVLPAAAVARDGAEAYVFRQNGDVFDRKPVHVVAGDRLRAVVANDGGVPPGVYVAQSGAAQLNRMIKSQSGAAPKGFHVHADGSVHMGSH